MDANVHTAAQRRATGLDSGARALIMQAVSEVSGANARAMVALLFRDRYGTPSDYFAAMEEVHGHPTRFACERAMNEAAAEAEFPMDFRRRVDPNEAGAAALLSTMPEADFRLAVEETLRMATRMEDAAPRITTICRTRGAPWVFEADGGFQWVGDATVQREVIAPALAAINDPRFAGGVRSEFEQARAELRSGTPVSRKQAVYEAGCAVESAMKVVLDEHQIAYDAQRDTAQPLFNHLEAAGLVPRYMERMVLAAATPRNRTAGHGAGAIPHNPDTAEAESVVAGAAGAIAYLHSKLP